MKYSMTKKMLTVNISPKLIMTETCNIYKFYCKNHGNFFLKLTKISEICIPNCSTCLIKYVKTLCLNLYVINGVEDLKYSWSAHKGKHNRWFEADITLYRRFVFFHGGHLETNQNGG